MMGAKAPLANPEPDGTMNLIVREVPASG